MARGFSPFLITLSFSIHLAISQGADFSSHNESTQRHRTGAIAQANALPTQFLREKLWVRL